MQTESKNPSRFYLWGIGLTMIVWLGFTASLEGSMGWPASREALGHRAIGWFMEFMLLRVFLVGMRRFVSKAAAAGAGRAPAA